MTVMAGLDPAHRTSLMLRLQDVDAGATPGKTRTQGGMIMARVAVVTGGTRGIGAAISKALKAAGYKVAANYGGNDEAAQKFKAETGIPVYKWDVSSYRRLRRRPEAGRGRSRPGRGAGQQCRHHPRRHVPPHEAGAVERGDQHQSQLAVQHVPAGDRGHARAQVRPHHQHLVDQRPEGPDGPGQLFRRQGRRARLHQGAGAGERARAASPSTRSARATSPPRWCRRCRRTCWRRTSCR